MVSPEEIVHSRLVQTYERGLGLAEHLTRFARELVDLTGAASGRMTLPGLGTLDFARRGDEVSLRWHAAHPAAHADELGQATNYDESAATAPPAAATRRHVFRMCYANEVHGELAVAWDDEVSAHSRAAALCQAAARACAVLMRRHAVRRWASEQLGQPLTLAGFCQPVRIIEQEIERAGQTRVPALIRGEFGTETLAVAVSLHCAGAQRSGPFIEVHCPSLTPDESLAALPGWLRGAAAGTLFFNCIDVLPLAAQAQILRVLPANLGQRISPTHAGPLPRILASTASDLRLLAREGRFSRELVGELEVLSLDVPPLRARMGDLEVLICHVLEKHGYSPRRKCSDELLAALASYTWPENLFELDRVLLRLALMTGDAPIGRDDVLRYTPWLLVPRDADKPPSPGTPPTQAPAQEPVDWLRAVADREAHKLETLHEGLCRALVYMGEHYQEPISLGQLARQAHVSPSHLSFLFKQSIGTNFKTLLTRLRIEKAKELLAQGGRQRITEVAADAGFTDLSHFEKTFRRFVATSPREYRSRIAAPA